MNKCIINCYEISYLYYISPDNEIHICFNNGEYLQINRDKDNINTYQLFDDIVNNLKDKYIIVDEKYIWKVSKER